MALPPLPVVVPDGTFCAWTWVEPVHRLVGTNPNLWTTYRCVTTTSRVEPMPRRPKEQAPSARFAFRQVASARRDVRGWRLVTDRDSTLTACRDGGGGVLPGRGETRAQRRAGAVARRRACRGVAGHGAGGRGSAAGQDQLLADLDRAAVEVVDAADLLHRGAPVDPRRVPGRDVPQRVARLDHDRGAGTGRLGPVCGGAGAGGDADHRENGREDEHELRHDLAAPGEPDGRVPLRAAHRPGRGPPVRRALYDSGGRAGPAWPRNACRHELGAAPARRAGSGAVPGGAGWGIGRRHRRIRNGVQDAVGAPVHALAGPDDAERPLCRPAAPVPLHPPDRAAALDDAHEHLL